MDSISGVGVLDKAFAIIDALEFGPRSLSELVAATGLSRATAHRLAVALETHGMVRRFVDERPGDPVSRGHVRFLLGLRLLPFAELARPVLERLRDLTGESVQLFAPQGGARVCVLSLESPHGLRTIVPLGATLPLDRGSAGRILQGQPTDKRGWIESVEEREPGVASVSAAVRDSRGVVVAAVSVSGPVQRTTRSPGRKYGAMVARAANELSGAREPSAAQ
jgi:DNA-binding IclR family transcriptional regulator